MSACHWCHGDCGGTCLQLRRGRQMQTDDPAYFLLYSDKVTTKPIHRDGCYICEDPEFAQMGMSVCQPCTACKVGHVPADDTVCDDCGADAYQAWLESQR